VIGSQKPRIIDCNSPNLPIVNLRFNDHTLDLEPNQLISIAIFVSLPLAKQQTISLNRGRGMTDHKVGNTIAIDNLIRLVSSTGQWH
jgi:hypothetical protein